MVNMAEEEGDKPDENGQLLSSDNVADQPEVFEHKNGNRENMYKTDETLCLPSIEKGDASFTNSVAENLLEMSRTSTINNEDEKNKNLTLIQASFSPTHDRKTRKSKIIMKWKLLPTSTPSSSSVKEKDELIEKIDDSKKSKGKTDNGEEPLPCHICKKIFKNKFRLNNHLRNKHNDNDITFTCEECGKEFSHVNGLRRHSRIHIEEKQFKCEICSQTFRYNYHLKRHMGIHAGEKPYECQYCFKHFNRKFNLKEHLRVHTGVKPYQCELCLKQFTQKSTLQNHMKVHNTNGSNEGEKNEVLS